MDEIEILPEYGSPKAKQLITSHISETYNISIRDYQCLCSPELKMNNKSTNRILGNRKRTPSEEDRTKERKLALAEIYDIISKQESRSPTPIDPTIRTVCHYKGKEIPYKKRSRKMKGLS